MGAGIVSIDRDQTNAHIMFVLTADMIEDVHFHKAIAGVNGGVIFPMGDLIANNGVFTYWKNTDATPFTLANSVQFRNDSIYLNVHTMDFPNGEVRGQVRRGVVCSETVSGLLEIARPTELSTWPVPVTDHLNITLPSDLSRNARVEVIDALGAVVREDNTGSNQSLLTMNVVALPSGLYFVRITDAGRVFASRFVKE